ncbi:hypothetical protein FIF78_23475 [Escherichia coli]|nr:hypothetical protein [Escherichia coli]
MFVLDTPGQAIRGEIKSFFLGFTVHSVHLLFFINNFMVIQGEYTVKGEQWIVHPVAMAGKEKTGCCRSEVGYVVAGSSHFGSQSP